MDFKVTVDISIEWATKQRSAEAAFAQAYRAVENRLSDALSYLDEVDGNSVTVRALDHEVEL